MSSDQEEELQVWLDQSGRGQQCLAAEAELQDSVWSQGRFQKITISMIFMTRNDLKLQKKKQHIFKFPIHTQKN